MKTKNSPNKNTVQTPRSGAARAHGDGSPWATLRRLLAARGDRLTPQRMAIYDAVVGRTTHPSVETVFGEVQQRFPGLSRATVYSTLSLFSDLGLIQEVSGPVRRYDGQTRRHFNLVCERCGNVVDVFDGRLDTVERTVAREARFEVKKTLFELHGVCSRCQRVS